MLVRDKPGANDCVLRDSYNHIYLQDTIRCI